MKIFKKSLGKLTVYIYNLRNRCFDINYFKTMKLLEISLYFWNVELLFGEEV